MALTITSLLDQQAVCLQWYHLASGSPLDFVGYEKALKIVDVFNTLAIDRSGGQRWHMHINRCKWTSTIPQTLLIKLR